MHVAIWEGLLDFAKDLHDQPVGVLLDWVEHLVPGKHRVAWSAPASGTVTGRQCVCNERAISNRMKGCTGRREAVRELHATGDDCLTWEYLAEGLGMAWSVYFGDDTNSARSREGDDVLRP